MLVVGYGRILDDDETERSNSESSPPPFRLASGQAILSRAAARNDLDDLTWMSGKVRKKRRRRQGSQGLRRGHMNVGEEW